MIEFKSPRDIFEEQEEKAHKITEIDDENKIEDRKCEIKKVMKRYSFEELQEYSKNSEQGYSAERKGGRDFYIGTKDKIEGQITFLEEEQKQKIILARVTRKVNKDYDSNKSSTGQYYYKTIYFNEHMYQKDKGFIWDTIEGDFYLYKLKTKEKTYQLFSLEKLKLGDYKIWGTIIEVLDYIDMGNDAKISKKIPFLFVHSAFAHETQIQSHKEFFERFEKYDLNEEKFLNWLYTSSNGWVYEFPKSFCYIQIANLFACGDDFNSFHLPVLMISETGTGKTTATELIFNRMNEIQEYTDMTSSTLKGLVPAFKSASDLQPGLFLESKRYVPIDEFFPGISNLHPEEKQKVMENIKNILDYKERAHRSGHGKIKGIMRAEHIALTNPKSYGNDALQLSNHFFPENLARYLTWYIPDSQIDFIKKKIDNKLKKGEYNYIASEDFLEGLDYLKTFNCSYDPEKIREIYNIGENYLKTTSQQFKNLRAMYSSRYFVHACRLIDSLTKFRCWVEGDKSFKSKKEDYDLLKKLWLEMLENWKIGFIQIEFEKINPSLSMPQV